MKRSAQAKPKVEPRPKNGGLLVLLMVFDLIAAWSVWTLSQERRIELLVRVALPEIPALPASGHVLEDQLRLTTAAARQSRPITALEELALLYHANGYRAQADQVERGLSQLLPQDARWPYYLADLCLAEGDTAGAERLLRETLRIRPNYAPAELKFADLLFRLGRGKESVHHYERRLELLPGDPYAHLGLARVAMQAADWSNAAGRLELLLRSSPKFPTAHNLLVGVYAELGKEKESADHFRLAAESGRFHEADDPWLAQIAEWSYDPYRLEVLGGMDRQTGRLEHSLPYYERAVRVSRTDGAAYNALGDVYRLLNRLDQAESILREGLTVAPETESLYGTLADVLRKRGKAAEAIPVVAEGVQRFPQSAELRNELAIAYENAGRSEEAIAAYQDAVRLNPDYADAYFNMGLRLRSVGRTAEGITSFRRTLTVRPSDEKTLLVLAQDELNAAHFDAAWAYLSSLSSYHPNSAAALRLLCNWYLRKGLAQMEASDAAAAEKTFRDGIEAVPEFPTLHANLGALLATRGSYEEALLHFERFLALSPEDLMGYYYVSQTLLALHRPADVLKVLERGVSVAKRIQRTPQTLQLVDRLSDLWAQATDQISPPPPSK